MEKIILNIFLVFVSLTSFSQLVTNNGALIYSDENSIISVQGSFNNHGTFSHNGYIVIDSTYSNFYLSSGSGIYDIFGNWHNSGTFICDTSHVHLKGTVQYFSGDSLSRFFNLSLEGTDKKIMQQNIAVKNQINLNALELQTTVDTLNIENSSLTAVLSNTVFGSEGFISSSGNGTFIRKTNRQNSYFFPLGSSSGTARFRPVYLTPENTSSNSYALSFVNYPVDNISNVDTSVCDLNNKFFHKINRVSGNAKANVNIKFIVNSDGYYNKLAKQNNTLWSSLNTSFLTSSLPYDFLIYPLWNNETQKLVLANKGARISSIHGDSIACQNLTGDYFTQNLPGYSPVWNLQGGTIQDSSYMSALWNTPGQNLLSVYLKNPLNNCKSNTLVYSVFVASLPVADFSLQQGTHQNDSYLTTIDQSLGNPVSWHWDFGNGTVSDQQKANADYLKNGDYAIELTVKNKYGCIDTLSKKIKIAEAISIPSAFTPDGDGSNDKFEILYNGDFQYLIKIVNRWGQEIWKGNQSSLWDGKTESGAECSAGTYYYFISGTMNSVGNEYNGVITLVR